MTEFPKNAKRLICGQIADPTAIHDLDPNVRCGFPAADMIAHTGEKLRFYEDRIANKVFVVNFMSIRDETRHATTERLVKTMKILGDRVKHPVHVSTITVDPGHDSVELLAEYAQKYDLPENWLFLRTHEEKAALIAERMYHFNRGVTNAGGMGRLAFYGNGMNGNRMWGTFPVGITAEDAALRISTLCPQEKPRIPVRAGPARPDEKVYPWSFRARA